MTDPLELCVALAEASPESADEVLCRLQTLTVLAEPVESVPAREVAHKSAGIHVRTVFVFGPLFLGGRNFFAFFANRFFTKIPSKVIRRGKKKRKIDFGGQSQLGVLFPLFRELAHSTLEGQILPLGTSL
jgi:hypothetical protein